MQRSKPTGDDIRADLAAQPDGILEAVAARHGVPMSRVLDLLGPEAAKRVGGGAFEAVWTDLAGWGDVTFVVHGPDGVIECKGTVSPGSFGRGYYNFQGESPISGHIRAERCRFIYFVDRPFFGRRSCSVQFVNEDGAVMFKVFVGRCPDRSLKEDQVARFESLRGRL